MRRRTPSTSFQLPLTPLLAACAQACLGFPLLGLQKADAPSSHAHLPKLQLQVIVRPAPRSERVWPATLCVCACAAGFANHLARPIFRDRHSDDMSEADAFQLLSDALRVCYYRDKISINKFQVAKVTKEGVSISDAFSLETKWDHKLFAKPTEWAVGAW